MKKLITSAGIMILFCLMTTSCNRNCLECSYRIDDSQKTSQEVCGKLPEKKKKMKAQMKANADSVGAELKCKGN